MTTKEPPQIMVMNRKLAVARSFAFFTCCSFHGLYFPI